MSGLSSDEGGLIWRPSLSNPSPFFAYCSLCRLECLLCKYLLLSILFILLACLSLCWYILPGILYFVSLPGIYPHLLFHSFLSIPKFVNPYLFFCLFPFCAHLNIRLCNIFISLSLYSFHFRLYIGLCVFCLFSSPLDLLFIPWNNFDLFTCIFLFSWMLKERKTWNDW